VTPRAVGVRAPYAAVPQRVRTWVDETLGSPVVETREQDGGMSPGCATRLTCADGSRAFIKAVGAELNPETPNLFRREITALTLLGRHPLWAGLLASYDEDGWVALLLEDVEGSHPDLSDDAMMHALLTDTDRLAVVMAQRVPDPPPPDPRNGGLTDMRRIYLRWTDSLHGCADVPSELMPTWVVERRVELAARTAALADLDLSHLVHWDIRSDNLLVRPTGEIVFLDWGACGLGPDWLDPLLARL
jgi:serine/threonine protein kinase